MKTSSPEDNNISAKITKKDLDFDKYLPDHLSIKDIDKSLYEFGLVYKHSVDFNDTHNEDVMKRRKLRHNLMMCFSLFNLMRFIFYIISSISMTTIPDYYFDLSKFAGGLFIYRQLIQLLPSLFIVKLCHTFGRADTDQMNWLSIIRVLKGISPVNQLGIHNQKYVNQFIRIVAKIHYSTNLIITFNKYTFLLWSIYIVLSNYNPEHLVKYGMISVLLLNTMVSSEFSIGFSGVKYFIIVTIYCIFLIKSINQHSTAHFTKMFTSEKMAFYALNKYHKNMNAIFTLNKFWKKIYSNLIYAFIPFNLICLQQIIFEKINQMLFIALLFTFLSTTLFLFSLNLMSAHIFKEVQRTLTILISLFNGLKQKSNPKVKLKVMIILNI